MTFCLEKGIGNVFRLLLNGDTVKENTFQVNIHFHLN